MNSLFDSVVDFNKKKRVSCILTFSLRACKAIVVQVKKYLLLSVELLTTDNFYQLRRFVKELLLEIAFYWCQEFFVPFLLSCFKNFWGIVTYFKYKNSAKRQQSFEACSVLKAFKGTKINEHYMNSISTSEKINLEMVVEFTKGNKTKKQVERVDFRGTFFVQKLSFKKPSSC